MRFLKHSLPSLGKNSNEQQSSTGLPTSMVVSPKPSPSSKDIEAGPRVMKDAKTASSSPSTSVKMRCSICLDDCFTIDELVFVPCKHAHSYCYGCLFHYLEICINGSNDSPPRIPTCAFSSSLVQEGNCQFTFEESDCTYLIEQAIHKKLCACKKGKEMIQRLERLYLVDALESLNCLRCPCCPEGQENWFALTKSQKEVPRALTCGFCKSELCSKCLRSPFHFGCSCNEVLSYTQAWVTWLQTGQKEYLQEVAKNNQTYQQALKEYEKKQDLHAQKMRDISTRHQNYIANENALVSICKRCPHCDRRIQKGEGCNNMVCAYGRYGCGKTFNWLDAPAYIPEKLSKATMLELFTEPMPQKHNELLQEISDGVPLPCDVCGQQIVGPCVQCIDCPSFVSCVPCNSNYSEIMGEDSSEGFRPHRNSHVCRVIHGNMKDVDVIPRKRTYIKTKTQRKAVHPAKHYTIHSVDTKAAWKELKSFFKMKKIYRLFLQKKGN